METAAAQAQSNSSAHATLSQQIAAEMRVSELTDRLLQYPTLIRRQQDAVQAAKCAVQEAQNELQLQESLIMSEIISSTDPRTGKAMFSNDSARKAELAQRMAASPEYQRALERFKDAEQALNAAQFDLDKLTNEFTAHRTVAQVIASRLYLMGGLSMAGLS